MDSHAMAIAEFARKLRWLGMDVSVSETADALRAISDADPLDRDQLRRRLQVTLVKRADDIPVFVTAFDLLFPAVEAGAQRDDPLRDDPLRDGAGGAPDLPDRLVSMLRGSASAAVTSQLAAEVISAYGGVGDGVGDGHLAGSQRYYEYRITRQLDLSALLRRAMLAENTEPELARRLAGLEQRERLRELRAEIAARLRERLARTRELAASLAQLKESVLDTEFLRAGPAELAALHAVVAPLARRLAATARRRRRMSRAGTLDVRRTMRRSIAVGGVPIDPAWRRRSRPRPRLLVLCDVSGSVAEFAKFTMTLLHALHAELPRLRSFVFADGVAEVTELIESSPGVIDTRLLLARPGVVRGDGHSDYGAVLRQFLDEQASGLSRDCVVIICGDARANYRPEQAAALRAVRDRVRAVHWLNPEPAAGWDTADSRMSAYRPFCDTVTEVRTPRQLGAWIDRLL